MVEAVSKPSHGGKDHLLTKGWDGMGWDGMGWDGLGWDEGDARWLLF